MSLVLGLQGWIYWAISILMLVIKCTAFVNCLLWRPDAFTAASKWSKKGWGIVLGIGVLLELLPVQGFLIFNLGFLVAALVYLVDVRPALKGLYYRR